MHVNPPDPSSDPLYHTTHLLMAGVLGLLLGCGGYALMHPLDRQDLRREKLGNRIALNTADRAQLELLPSIGPGIAEHIVRYRARHGRFEKVEHVDRVPQIGPARLERLQPWVRLDPRRAASP